MLVSIFISYTGGIFIDRFKKAGEMKAARGALIGLSVISLSLLAFFKYADFVVLVLTAWLGLAAYTFQIYFDFFAYSDMAVGLGHMFGFRFPENFILSVAWLVDASYNPFLYFRF